MQLLRSATRFPDLCNAGKPLEMEHSVVGFGRLIL
jgi:hypothetical protein